MCLGVLFPTGGSSPGGEILLDPDRVNELGVGQVAYIVLGENRTTPYWWDCAISDESVVALVRDEYIMDPNPRGADGAGGVHWYYFEAIGPGECTVDMRLCYLAGDEEPVQSVTYGIVVSD
jgi:predicted secreted protein